jgi:hypothetical protein
VHSKLEQLVNILQVLTTLQSFCTIVVLHDDGPIRPKHVGVSGFYNIIVNLIEFCALFGFNLQQLNFKARNGKCEVFPDVM